jgi:SNF2 family DNA or RNA helicase
MSLPKSGYGTTWFCVSKSIERKYRNYLDKTNLKFHSYQLDGVKWCINSEINPDPNPLFNNVRGGFIADEMGLGKTIMMIGTMLCNPLKRTLIVVPIILMEQWYNQIYKTTGHKALIYHGYKKKNFCKEDIENATIVITSYAYISIKKNKDMVQQNNNGSLNIKPSLLHEIPWSRVVFDEAHHLRNKSTGRNIGSKYLKTDIIWLISGTPIQNTRKDFYHLCSTLGISSFEDKNIPDILERFVLRRTKKEVGLDCGELDIIQQNIPWKNKKEHSLSLDIHSYLAMNKLFKEATLLNKNKSDKNDFYSPFENKRILELYLRAKQSCILPSLMGPTLSGRTLWTSNYSSKINAVVAFILNKKKNGNGKIVFCNYRFEMDTVASKLIEGGFSSNSIQILDGRITGADRKKCLNELELYSVLIIQIQTGCEGLNLQEYFNEVYFVSPHWNPCVEDQAIARCYRMGQNKKVFVYKFAMVNDCYRCNISECIIGCIQMLPKNIVEKIIEYIPTCNYKWINMDEYIISIQDIKREMIKEFIM